MAETTATSTKPIPIKGDEPDTNARPVDAPAKDVAYIPPTVPVPSADGRIEYVAGGERATVYANVYQALAQRVDDATLEFGYPLYDQMLKDAVVQGAYSLLKQGVLEEPVILQPAKEMPAGTHPDDIENDADPDEKLSQEIVDFIDYCLDRLDRALEDTLYELLDAIVYGSKAAELIFDIAQFGEYKGKMILKAIKCKPRWAWAWVVDPMSNVIGILGAVPGVNAAPLGLVGARGDVSGYGVLLPRNKFAILTNMPVDGDPRGQSHFRCIVGPWNQKIRTYPQYSNYLDRFAVGHLFATVPDNAQPQYPIDSAGAVIPGAALIPATQFLYQQMVNFSNGSALVGPAGTTLTNIPPAGDGGVFDTAFTFLDKQMVFGILYTTRGILEAEHGSRADSEVGQDEKAHVIKYYRGVTARMLIADVVYPLVKYNWGDEIADRLCPRVVIGQTEAHDFATDAAAVASLTTSGYLHLPSQATAVDARLGLPIRKVSAEEYEAKLAAETAAGAVAPDDNAKDGEPADKPADKPAAKTKPAAKPKPAPAAA